MLSFYCLLQACQSLKPEYERICFTKPLATTAKETKAFCNAFIEMCKNLLGTAG